MIRWGINAMNHGNSLAVFKDHELKIWHASHDDAIPSEVIHQALHFGSPDEIYWYERPWVKKARQIYAGQYKTALRLDNLPSRYIKKSRLDYAKVIYTPHHASHAAAGYYTSPFNHCAIVVLDAIGEFECATIWEGKHGELKKVWSRNYPHSLGLFYSAFTKLVGLEPIKQEGIFEAMAKQGDSNRYKSQVKQYMGPGIDAHKNLHRGVQDWPEPISNLQDQCDIAAAVQTEFNFQLDAVMSKAKELTDADCLIYMGGCAFNATANKQVEQQWNHIWSLPNPGDASSSIGAVLYHTKQRVWDWRWKDCKHITIKV
jgi:carbamoyltransferase